MDKIDMITLRKMSYNELRAYAKKLNIKCNAKANKLIDAILEKVSQKSNDSSNSYAISENGDLAHNSNTASVATPWAKEPLNTVKENASKTPASVSKARRRTYELTPETTLVLDVDTAEDVAKINLIPPARATTPISATIIQAKLNKDTAMNARSKIPVQGKKTGARVCATPNFKKLHERQFAKMDSLDVYVAKKAARREKNKSLPPSIKSVRSLGLKFVKQNPTVEESNIFKPSVLSTSAMNLNFIPTTKTRQAKASFAKSKIPTVSNKMPFRFVGKSVLNSNRTPLRKLPVPSNNTITKPTFRYQPPKCQEKDTVNGIGARKPVREKARSMLKGVRLNKRFELQLLARGIALK